MLSGAGAGCGLALRGLVARALAASPDYRHLVAAKGAGGYGPLRPVPSSNTREALLALPENFQYTVFGRTGAPMSDKRPTPRAHDGMAVFAVRGQLRLVRNHEINDRVPKPGVALAPARSYDETAGGGTTTLVVDPRTRTLVRDFVSLSGTLQNCAGGPTPWGSWITCEETRLNERRFKDAQGREAGGFAMKHGYCFEVPAASDAAASPIPLKAMGRFVH